MVGVMVGTRITLTNSARKHVDSAKLDCNWTLYKDLLNNGQSKILKTFYFFKCYCFFRRNSQPLQY
jgi:hypothetical protein